MKNSTELGNGVLFQLGTDSMFMNVLLASFSCHKTHNFMQYFQVISDFFYNG